MFVRIVASCGNIRFRRAIGFVTLFIPAASSVMLSIVVGPGVCRERTSEEGLSAVER